LSECLFCRIAAKTVPAVGVYEDEVLFAFLDVCPIREGHVQVIPKAHFECFDVLPDDLASRILSLGQKIATRLKAVYGVRRVGFMFSGGDIAHAHAHIVPMHDKTDLISARFAVSSAPVEWSMVHLKVDRGILEVVRDKLALSTGRPDADR
jgi:histidine triad (HIT) family protein